MLINKRKLIAVGLRNFCLSYYSVFNKQIRLTGDELSSDLKLTNPWKSEIVKNWSCGIFVIVWNLFEEYLNIFS